MVSRKAMYAALAISVLGAVNAKTSQSMKNEVDSRRAEGPAGLEKFIRAHQKELARGDFHSREALDRICAQYDCNSSKLYWHTDIEAAKATARAEHKPILSLRLLGRLDEELSCANSRFFRKLLYPDPRVSAFLREHYVLHWESVRPVPKVTIDFGDGRVLKQTITGNSIHYVLDSDGRPIDAIPGMVAPEAFLASLSQAETLARTLAPLAPDEREVALEQWHRERLEQTLAAWEGDLRRLDPQTAIPKTMPLLQGSVLEKASEGRWSSIAALHRLEAALDPTVEMQTELAVTGALEARRSVFPTAWEAAPIAYGKLLTESPLLRQLKQAVAEDTVRNRYQLHRQIHEWLTVTQYNQVESLNARVYSQLFLSPLNDPWYGLKPASVFSGLDDA